MATDQSSLFIELYRDNHDWLFSWLKKKIRCQSDAADLAQDTFFKLLTKSDLSKLNEPRAFLTTVATNQLISAARRKKIEQEYLNALSMLQCSDSFASAEDHYLAVETLVLLSAMLDGLSSNVRQTFLLSRLEDASHSEIAEQLGVSVSMVKQYLAKALVHCYQYQHN